MRAVHQKVTIAFCAAACLCLASVLPAGMTADGLPIAIEILGRPFSESKLIDLANAYEQASRARVAPRTTPALSGDVFVF